MLTSPRILLRVDANNSVGMGHAIRLSSLVGLLHTRCNFFVAGNDETLKMAFPHASIHVVASDDDTGFRRVLDTVKPDLVIVDLPPSIARPWKAIREWAQVPIIALDDEGGELDADLIINGTALDKYHQYKCPSDARILCGTQFTMIRPVFSAHSWSGADTSVAIVVGSGERAEAWALMLASGAVNMSAWGAVRMVVGHSFKKYAQLASHCQQTGINLQRSLSGEALASLVCQSAVALITGGMIVYETLAMGVPAVVFPQIPNLVPEAEWFSAQGAIVDLNYDGGMDPLAVEKAVGHLLSNRESALTMSAKQREILDGRGMERAAAAIDSLLQSELMK